MEIETIRALLIFGAGVLAFSGQIIPIIVRFWESKDANSRDFFLTTGISLFILLLSVVPLVAAFIWHSYITAALVLLLYIVALCGEFARRTGPVHRWEVALLVCTVAFAVAMLAAMLTNMLLDKVSARLLEKIESSSPK